MTRTLAALLLLAATTAAGANTQTTAKGADACRRGPSYLMQATCAGATAASWTAVDDAAEEESDGETDEDQGPETLCVWGRKAEVLSRTTSGRPGYDAVRVRWPDGRESYVLEPRGVDPGCGVPTK